MEKKKKFDINTIDIETSSQESKFNVDEQQPSNSDLVDKFQSIGEDYAGSGLTGQNSAAAQKEAQLKEEQDFGLRSSQEEPKAFGIQPQLLKPTPSAVSGSEMMESMYGTDFNSCPPSNPAKVPSTIKEVSDETDNREAGFSSISNVRENDKRPILMNQLASEANGGAQTSGAKNPAMKPSAELFSAQNKFSLATNDQWGFQGVQQNNSDSQRSSRLGNSARLSQQNPAGIGAGASINMQDYDTINQMNSLEAKREAHDAANSGGLKSPSDAGHHSNYSQQRQSNDAALADALKKNRSLDQQAQDDDIVAKMTLEMQQDGSSRDVQHMDRVQASASHNSRATSKISKVPTTSIKNSLQNSANKKKVKGNMGLAIQHGADVADAVQLDANIIRAESEEDIFADDVQAQQEVKVKGDDDFGMSSDEEDALNRRKRDQKKREAEQRRVQQEEEAQRIIEEQKELTRKAEELKARFAKGEMLHVKQQAPAPEAPAEPSSIAQLSPDPKAVDFPISQVMSFEDEQNNSSMHVQFQDVNSGLTPVAEQQDETTDANVLKKQSTIKNENKDTNFEMSPNQLNTLRSDQKMLPASRIPAAADRGEQSSIAGISVAQAPADKTNSEIINIDDSRKDVSSIINDTSQVHVVSSQALSQAPNTTSKNTASNKAPDSSKKPPQKPSFLGRLGAMIGLMQQSNFAGQEEEDGRLGSASSSKSREKAPANNSNKNDGQFVPDAGSAMRPSSSHFVPDTIQSKQEIESDHHIPNSDKKPPGTASSKKSRKSIASREASRQSSANRRSRHSNSSNKKMRPADDQKLIKIDGDPGQQFMMEEEEKVQQDLGGAIQLTPAAESSNIILRTTQTAENNKNKLQINDEASGATPKTNKDGKLSDQLKDDAGLQMNDRQKRQQARLLKAAKEGKELNDSYYDEVESQSNEQQENIDPYEINHKHGYESSSTAHREKSSAATKLKKKLASFQKEEVTTSKVQPDLAHSKYVNPEKDETHALFATRKSMLQDQGIVLRKGDFNQLHPHSGKQAVVDTLRFAGCFIYLTDLSLKIAYYNNSKFISEQIRDMWMRIFQVRPLFIVFYHVMFAIFSFFRSYNEYAKQRQMPNYNQVSNVPSASAKSDANNGVSASNNQNQDDFGGEKDPFAEEIAIQQQKDYRREVAKSTLQRLCEITTQALLLPFTMYSGFSRLTSLREIKTNYLYIGLGQELILHQVPLSLLFFYNQAKLDKPSYTLDSAVEIVAIIHCAWLLFEICMFRSYMNKGVNLEQRIKHATDVRIKDLVRLWFIACLIGGLFMMPAFMAFNKQECKSHYYEVGDWECHDCFDFHGDECISCIDSARCNKCVTGHYLHNNTCHTCASYWPGCVDCVFDSKTEGEKNKVNPILNTIDLNPINPLGGNLRNLQSSSDYSGGELGEDVVSKIEIDPETLKATTVYFDVSKCLKAAHGFFFDKNNQVVSCKTLQNCAEDSCGEFGCEKCIDGYYLENNECVKCDIIGCAKCSKKDQCTECTSDFLSVQEDGSCGCNIEDGIFPHMTKDRYGSCKCDDGYWLTEFGCQTCEELIPGCEQCYRTASNTMIPLYEGANVGRYSRQYYIDCRKCPYHDYRQRANVSQNQKPRCVPCAEKWDGCGYCGTYGNRCTKCLETHVYQSRNYYNPCRPCWCWMGKCIWCRGQNDCVKYWDTSLPWPEYDLSCS